MTKGPNYSTHIYGISCRRNSTYIRHDRKYPKRYHMSLGWLPTFNMTKTICNTILISHVVGVSPTFDMHVVGVSPTFDMWDLPIIFAGISCPRSFTWIRHDQRICPNGISCPRSFTWIRHDQRDPWIRVGRYLMSQEFHLDST